MSDTSASGRAHGYGLVLLLVLVSVSFQVAAPDESWSRALTTVLGAATLTLSVRTAGAHRGFMRIAALATVVLAAGSVILLLAGGDVPAGTASIVNGALVALAPAVIAVGLVRQVREAGAVTLPALAGVLAIYLMLGMFFSFFYAAAAELGSQQFFAGAVDPGRSDFLYFSYITQATVGFGDLAPLTDVGRMFAVVQALTGQIYMVTVVALIVANLRRPIRSG